jgi:hypothetical protein
MSEYEYYEFQAVDRPLTEEQQRAVAELSSRVEPHPRRAVFTYSFGGGLRRRPEDLVAEYYDAMLYLANWGSRQLMFRFPKRLIDMDQIQQYSVVTREYASDAVDVYTKGKYAILNIQLHEEEGFDWIEGEGWLDSLVSLRDAVLRQDYRLLYLAWLRGVTLEYDVDEEAREPPVPPGLQTLSLALENFVELFNVDEDLIQAAAASSGELQKAVSGDDLRGAIARLTPEERDRFLLRLAKGEPHLTLALNRRLRALTGLDAPPGDAAARRTVGELFAEAEAQRERRVQEQKARAEAKRVAELEALAEREEKAWREVDALIQQSQAKPYDQAVELLKKLRDLAGYQRSEPVFEGHMRQLCDLYGRRPALMRRLRQAKLVPVDE